MQEIKIKGSDLDLNHNPVPALSMGLFWDDILIFLHKGKKNILYQWQLRTLQRFLWDGRRNQGSTLLLLKLLWLSHLAKADYFGNSGCAEEWKWSAPFNCQATFPAPGNTRRAVLSQSLARIFPCQYNPLEIRFTVFVFCTICIFFSNRVDI